MGGAARRAPAAKTAANDQRPHGLELLEQAARARDERRRNPAAQLWSVHYGWRGYGEQRTYQGPETGARAAFAAARRNLSEKPQAWCELRCDGRAHVTWQGSEIAWDEPAPHEARPAAGQGRRPVPFV